VDANRDSRLDENEFSTWWRQRGLYNRWNTDGTAGLTEAEFSRGAYGAWERNEAGSTEAEWNAGTGGWFDADAKFDAFDEWDVSRNNLVEEDEYVAGADRYGLFDGWNENRDEMLDEEEFDDGIFDIFDANYLRALRDRQPFRVEYRLRRADGRYCWILESGAPRFTPQGEFAGSWREPRSPG